MYNVALEKFSNFYNELLSTFDHFLINQTSICQAGNGKNPYNSGTIVAQPNDQKYYN